MGQLYSLFTRAPDLGDANRAAINRILDAEVPPAAPGDATPFYAGIGALLERGDIPEEQFIALARDYALHGAARPGYPLHNLQVTVTRADEKDHGGPARIYQLVLVGDRK